MAKNKKRILIFASVALLLILLFAGACKFAESYLGIYVFPPSASGYGKAALHYIDANGIYASGQAWENTYAECLAALDGVSTYADTYPVIEKALAVGGGKHAFLQKAGTAADSSLSEKSALPTATLNDGIAKISLPAFMGSAEAGAQYAAAVENFLHDNRDAISGILLDLRGNTGGDVGPMITAVSALLPDGDLMYYDYSSYSLAVSLKDGKVTNGGSGGSSLYPTEKLNVPVAVLVNECTASSAEVLLLCFRGLENVRVYGCDTAGYSSVNMQYNLFDGAQMFLTVAADKARTGEVFLNQPISPDIATDVPEEAAADWLILQAAQ